MSDAIEALIAKQEIYELSCRYMRGLDRLDAQLMRDQFWEDGWCEYGFYDSNPSEFIDFCMQALQDHVANQHMIGNVLVELDGDEAYGEVYFQAYHKVAAESGYEDVIIAGRYRDRYQRRDGIWKFAYRSEIVDWSRTEPTQDSYFELAPNCIRGGRQDDPIYRREDRRKP